MCRCVRCDQRFADVAGLLAHIRDEHSRPASSGAGDRLLAAWSAEVAPRT